MIRIALAGLRHRVAAFVATFLAVLLGSSLLIACGGLFESGLRLNALPQRLAGAPVLVTGPAGFKLPDEESEVATYAERAGVTADALAKIRAVPGIADAVPDLSFPAVVPGQGGAGGTVLSGHDWTSAALTPYTLTGGAAPAEGEVVLDAATAGRAGATVGGRVRLVVAGTPQSFLVSGVARPDGRVDAAAMFFATADVQRFSTHPGQADVVGVRPAEGTSADDLAERIQAALPEFGVFTGDDRGAAEFPGITSSMLPLILLSSTFGAMVVVVMALVVWATISLSVRQRRQELALLRATGALPSQVRRLVVAETMAVAVLAVAGALLLGHFAGVWIFDESAKQGVVPSVLVFRQGLVPFGAGALLGLVTPLLAARFAAGAAANIRPVQALAEAAIPSVTLGPVRRLLAIIFLVVTLGLALTTMFLDPDTASAIGGPALLTGTVAVALSGSELVVFLTRRADGLIKRFTPRNGVLASINVRSRAVQFAAVLTPLTLATSIALGNVYAETTQEAAALAANVDQFSADAVIGSDAGGAGPGLLDAVRSTPGVASATALATSKGWLEHPYDGRGTDPWPLLGVDAQGDDPVVTTPVASGSLRDLTGNTVAIPVNQADDLGLAVGSEVTLRLGDGAQAAVRVVALLDGPSDYGAVMVPVSLLAPHTDSGLPSRVLVRAADGQDPSALVDVLRTRTQAFPGTTVGDRDALTAEFEAGLGVQAWISFLLAGLAMAYAAIATVNTQAVMVLSRRREFAVQRLAGATRSQVTRMLLVESTIIAAAGLVLGTAISLCTVLPTALAVGVVVPRGPVWVFLAIVVAVFVIVWPVTVFMSRLAMRRNAVEAIARPS